MEEKTAKCGPKKCFKCLQTKPLEDFYRHPMMRDGHLNKCKECTKIDTRKNRKDNLQHYVEYDRERANLPHRVAGRDAYRKTQAFANKQLDKTRRYRHRYPEKNSARQAVSNAVRDGKLVKGSCEVCGSTSRIHGHHDDYSRPLDVRWLCPKHHSEWHKTNTPWRKHP